MVAASFLAKACSSSSTGKESAKLLPPCKVTTAFWTLLLRVHVAQQHKSTLRRLQVPLNVRLVHSQQEGAKRVPRHCNAGVGNRLVISLSKCNFTTPGFDRPRACSRIPKASHHKPARRDASGDSGFKVLYILFEATSLTFGPMQPYFQ